MRARGGLTYGGLSQDGAFLLHLGSQPQSASLGLLPWRLGRLKCVLYHSVKANLKASPYVRGGETDLSLDDRSPKVTFQRGHRYKIGKTIANNVPHHLIYVPVL